jgi:WD40 repeat protein
MASGSSDGIVQLYDAGMKVSLQILEGHLGEVTSIAFSLDGKLIASGSTDDIVRLWDTGTGALL